MQRVRKQPWTEAALAEAEERCMEFAEILVQAIDLLACEKRLSYRALKLRFSLADEYLAGFKEEMIYAKRLARLRLSRDSTIATREKRP
jgi:hypothetical protein